MTLFSLSCKLHAGRVHRGKEVGHERVGLAVPLVRPPHVPRRRRRARPCQLQHRSASLAERTGVGDTSAAAVLANHSSNVRRLVLNLRGRT
ncbi:hypothetical protein C0J52_27710 [Blattella germanica]|nr:hypothetical protein C0J52_27710 [Blattella germanica]